MGKGVISGTFTCDFTQNGMLTQNGLALTTGYNVAPDGLAYEETDGNFNIRHFNVYWDGRLLGSFAGMTYSQGKLVYRAERLARHQSADRGRG